MVSVWLGRPTLVQRHTSCTPAADAITEEKPFPGADSSTVGVPGVVLLRRRSWLTVVPMATLAYSTFVPIAEVVIPPVPDASRVAVGVVRLICRIFQVAAF